MVSSFQKLYSAALFFLSLTVKHFRQNDLYKIGEVRKENNSHLQSAYYALDTLNAFIFNIFPGEKWCTWFA